MKVWGPAAPAPSPADAVVPGATEHWVRSVDVDAPPELLWRWLCQLRAAPYSYDWIDNFGRRSPQHLQPGLEELEVGQKLLIAFRIAAFETGRSLTILTSPRSGFLPPFAVAYEITPGRLTATIRAQAPRRLPGPVGRAAMAALCAGDLVMMRRQLLNLKRLAERDARLSARSAA